MMGSILTVALGILAASCSSDGHAQPRPHDLHGATPFADQLTAFDALTRGFDPAIGPPWVDPAIWKASIPKDNEPTPARVTLGRKLFFDPRLSKDGTVACATCHDAARSFTDLRPTSEGIGGKVGRRNSPTTMNAALLGTQFWDGRALRLEDQALLPIVNPIEMGFSDGASAVAAIAGDAEYRKLFEAAYSRAPNYEDIGRALATFQRTHIFLDAPFDAFLRGDATAISEEAKRGWLLYNGKGRCQTCHPLNAANPLGSDGRFHNVGVSARHQDFIPLAGKALAVLTKDGSQATIDELALGGDTSELGRFIVTRNETDIGGFRTPQIRNAGITGPYMHDGSMQTLWDVMDHYNRGGEANPYLDGGIEPLALSEPEIADLVALMFSMTDRRFADANNRAFAQQRDHAKNKRPFREDDLAQRRRLPFAPVPAGSGSKP